MIIQTLMSQWGCTKELMTVLCYVILAKVVYENPAVRICFYHKSKKFTRHINSIMHYIWISKW